MKTLKLTLFICTFVIASCIPNQLLAQEHIAPINYNPQQKNKVSTQSFSLKTTALSLPFFEDFELYDPLPDAVKWQDQQVYINNTMGQNPISRGVATFDALNSKGIPYDTTNATVLRYADSLTCKAIDLSGKTAADSIFMSFWYQAAGNGFVPEKQDSLLLYFRSKVAAKWIKVWSKSDSVLGNFRQVILSITDTNYLHANFQFRFVNKASIGTNDDIWNLDYIRLDAGRNSYDTLVNDVAFTQNPSALLNDYFAMPYRQYIASASAERATTINTTIQNNFTSNQTLRNYGFIAQQLGTSVTLGTDAATNKNINGKSKENIDFNSYATLPSAGAYDRVVFEHKFFFEAIGGDNNRENDTIVGQQVFDNYLAYDDGTAEMSYFLNLFPTLPGKIAVEHHLNQADTLRGLAIYFGRQVPLAKSKYFSIVVYKNIAYGASSMDDVIYEMENLQPDYVDTINHFWVYKFDKPVAMPAGTFYIGTTQPALSGSDSLYIGLDRNRVGSNHAYFNVLNVWNPSVITGALMMRPILGQAIIGTDISNYSSNQVSNNQVWPNPCTQLINYSIAHFGATVNKYEIINALGRVVQKGDVINNKGSLQLNDLPNAFYQINFYENQTLISTHKIQKQ
ncbi:MAG: T9SS type A sorting domain-containing protein [Chitinophagaceae bacterium]|nr:T9SS type A sorting domain-containing protein [Chitinophagaceae bacterium]